MKENSKKNKHMTLDDRIEIQECLGKGMTFKAIARRIGKSQTTVFREIKSHVKPYTNGFTKQTVYARNYLRLHIYATDVRRKAGATAPIADWFIPPRTHKRSKANAGQA